MNFYYRFSGLFNCWFWILIFSVLNAGFFFKFRFCLFIFYLFILFFFWDFQHRFRIILNFDFLGDFITDLWASLSANTKIRGFSRRFSGTFNSDCWRIFITNFSRPFRSLNFGDFSGLISIFRGHIFVGKDQFLEDEINQRRSLVNADTIEKRFLPLTNRMLIVWNRMTPSILVSMTKTVLTWNCRSFAYSFAYWSAAVRKKKAERVIEHETWSKTKWNRKMRKNVL